MASGYGINGGTSRCFPFWQAVVKCYSETDNPGKCTLHKEDYNECLHHSKAKAKQARIKSEFQRIRADGVSELRRQSDIYKAMGRAGGASVGLIEHIIAKSAVAKHQDKSAMYQSGSGIYEGLGLQGGAKGKGVEGMKVVGDTGGERLRVDWEPARKEE